MVGFLLLCPLPRSRYPMKEKGITMLEAKQANILPVSKFATVPLALGFALPSPGNIDSLIGSIPSLQTHKGCVRNFVPGEWLTEQI